MGKVEPIIIPLKVDGKELNVELQLSDRQIKKLRQEAEGFSGSMVKWSMMVTGFNQGLEVIQKVYGVISQPVENAAQFEQYETSLKVMLGSADAAKQRLSELVDFAKTTPFELPQVVEAANQLQAIGKYSQENLRMLGDLSAASGKPMEQAMAAYAKLMTGQKGIAIDMFRDLLISADDWSKATGAKIGANGELQASVEEMAAALPKILKEKGFDGMMSAQAETLNGMVSNFKDGVGQLQTVIGNALSPVIKQIVGDASEFVQSLIPVVTKQEEASEAGFKLSERFDELSFMVERLGSKINRTADEETLYQEALDALQKEYPNYFKSLDIHTSKYDEQMEAIKKAREELDKYIESTINAAIAQDKMTEITDLGKKRYEATKKKLEAERLYNEAEGAGTLDREDPELKRNAVLMGNRQKQLTTREILNAQYAEAQRTIDQANKQIGVLRKEVENINKSSIAIIAPTVDNKDNSTKKDTQEKNGNKKDPLAEAAQREKETVDENISSVIEDYAGIAQKWLEDSVDWQSDKYIEMSKQSQEAAKKESELYEAKKDIFNKSLNDIREESTANRAKLASRTTLNQMLISEELRLRDVEQQIRDAKSKEQLSDLEKERESVNNRIDIIKQEQQAREQLAQQQIQAGMAAYNSEKSLAENLKEIARENIKRMISEAVMSQISKVISTVPWPFNLVVAPLAGIALQALIEKLVPKFEAGGWVSGPAHSRGGVMANLEGDEFIVKKRSAQKYGPILEMINQDKLNMSSLSTLLSVRRSLEGVQYQRSTLERESIRQDILSRPIELHLDIDGKIAKKIYVLADGEMRGGRA